MSRSTRDVDLVSLRMIEAALEHPHAFNSPVEVKEMRSIGNDRLDTVGELQQIAVEYRGEVTVSCLGQKNVLFRGTCVMIRDNEKLVPLLIDIRVPEHIYFAVVGRCVVNVDPSGKKTYTILT